MRTARPHARALAAVPVVVGTLVAGLFPFAGAALAGPATQLAFTTPPGGGQAWSAFPTQPVVSLLDSGGDVDTSSSAQVTLAIGTNPGDPPGTLTCNGSGAGGRTVTAIAGIASFAGCRIDRPGSGYTLVASATGVAGATSTAFNVTPGQNHLRFRLQPGGGEVGTAWATQPEIVIEDPGGVVDTSSTATVTLEISANPGGGSLTCTGGVSRTAVAGVATFGGCRIDRPGIAYTLTATAPSIVGATSTGFNVAPGIPAKVAFSVQPGGGAAGTAMTVQPSVEVQDAGGFTVTTSTASVTLSITPGTGTPGAVLSCTGGLTRNAAAGVATFAGCEIDRAGTGYRLTATSPGLASVASNTFTVNQAPPSRLGVVTQPSATAQLSTAFATQPVIAVLDEGGNTVTSSTLVVTLGISGGTGTPGATLSCTGGLAKAAAAGVATFSGCKLDRVGTGYTLTASASGVASATTTAIDVQAGAPTKLAFTTQPAGSQYGTPFAAQPVIAIQDAAGNTVTSSTAPVTLAIKTGTGPSGAVLSCASGTTKTAVNGVAAFSGCSVNKVGTGYQLAATSSGLVAASSSTFDIGPGPASKLAFTTQPVGSSVGLPFTTQPVVMVQDAAGNQATSSTAAVTLSITSGTGTPGATLSCTAGTTVSAISGLASFGGCEIDRAGTGYMLTATASGLAGTTSATFAVAAGSATRVVYSTLPGDGVVGSPLAPQPILIIQDAGGNTVTTSTAAVTLSLGSNPTGATLTCSNGLTKNAAAGIVTFAGCKLDRVGSGYTITATSAGLMGSTSGTVDVVAAAPAKLAFTTQPAGASYGSAFTTQPVITVQDSLGNTTPTYSGTVILSITPGSGVSGAIISCAGGLTRATVNGVATFTGCSIDRPASGYRLTATATGVTNATSDAFLVAPGPPTSLGFTTQPAGASAGVAFTTQPVVVIRDAGGNTVGGSSAVVSLSISTGSGVPGASLACSGGTSVIAAAGVATFSGCAIDRYGPGYTLTATSTSLTPGTSATFAVAAGVASKLAFTTQPAGAAVGTAFTTQPVITVQDAGGNTVLTGAPIVTLAIATGTGTSGATLSCTGGLTRTAANGVATFSGCQISKVGSGYVLKATATGLTAALSDPFAVTAGAPSKLAVVTQPVGAAWGSPLLTQPVVAIQDAAGNTVTASTANVTLAIATNPGGGTLSCTGGLTKAAVAGTVAFDGCTIDRAGTGYTLTMTSPGLAGATTSAFTMGPGAPTRVTFTTQPADATYNAAFPTQPVVKIQDAQGNVVTTSTATVILSITPASGIPGAVLTCSPSTSKAATSGTATFSGCKIDRPGAGYTLTASSAGLTSAVSSTLTIAPGPPAKLLFSTQPVGAPLGSAWAGQPAVRVADTAGNTVTTSSATVTLSITSGTGTSGATLDCGGTTSAGAVAGVATFSGCSIDRAGSGYTLKATSGSLTFATSGSFSIATGPPTKLAFTTQPSGGTVVGPFPTQPIVSIQDSGGTVASTATNSVTLSIGTNPSGGTLSCTGGLTRAAVAGVVSFSGCAIDRAGAGYTIRATAAGLDLATSAAFTVASGPPAVLVLTSEPPASTIYGVAFAVQPVVEIRDGAGNVATTSTASVTLAITPGAGTDGAKLTCAGGLAKNAAAGVATFSGCKIDKAGSGYTLTATSGALATDVTAPFSITPGAASKLGFTTQPGSAAAGAPLSPQPVISLQDAAGNTVASSATTITLALSGGATGATLACTGGLTKAAVSGVATFAGCAVDKVGTGFSITATASGVTSAKSSTFAIAVGPAAALLFTTQPGASTAGKALTPQPIVKVVDAAGNVVAGSTPTITLAIATGSGASGATLACTGGLGKKAASGVSTFAGCAVGKAGKAYKLAASADGLTAATSEAFDIAVGTPAKLAWTTQPGGGTATTAWPAQPVVTVQDAGGDTVTTGSVSVTLSITSGTGTSGAKLTCTGGLTKAATAGVATFAGCSIDKAGTGYTLTAKTSGATSDASASFAVAESASTSPVAFTTQPGGGSATKTWRTQPIVTIRGTDGKPVTSGADATATVTLSVASGTGTSGAKLMCTGGLSKAAVAGVATFAGCAIDKDGTGYKLTATVTGKPVATSSTFTIGEGAGTDPGGGTTPAAPIAVVASAKTVLAGRSLILAVVVTGDAAGKPLLLERSTDQYTWEVVGTVTPDATGRVTVTSTPTATAWYRARVAPGAGVAEFTSTPVRVIVRQTIKLRPMNSKHLLVVARGAAVTLSVTVRPIGSGAPRAKVAFYVYRKVGGSWAFVTKRTVTATAAGIANLRWKFSKSGTWSVRAVALASPLLAASTWSQRETFTVK